MITDTSFISLCVVIVPSTRRVKSSQQSKSAKSTRNRTASADLFRNLNVNDGEDERNYLRCTEDNGGALSSGILRRRSISESEVTLTLTLTLTHTMLMYIVCVLKEFYHFLCDNHLHFVL